MGSNKNINFKFMAAKGINTAVRAKTCDVMLDFSYIAGDYNEKYQNFKWKPLTYCAKYYGYTDYAAHDALEDVRATLYCYYAMQRDKRGRRAAVRNKRRLEAIK